MMPVSSYVKYVVQKIDLWILARRGLKIGRNVFIGLDVKIDPIFPCLISIGDECRITANTIILSHDSSIAAHTGEMPAGRVTIGRNTTIGCGSIILPGVTIGDNVIVGAGSVVTKDVPDNSVACGNPCRVVESVGEAVRKQRERYPGPVIYFDDVRGRRLDDYLQSQPGINVVLVRMKK
jgi:maltose O-acetyltransferase